MPAAPTHVAFVYAGDLWVANLDGSDVRRLTTHPQGAAVSAENDYAVFTRLTLHY